MNPKRAETFVERVNAETLSVDTCVSVLKDTGPCKEEENAKVSAIL